MGELIPAEKLGRENADSSEETGARGAEMGILAVCWRSDGILPGRPSPTHPAQKRRGFVGSKYQGKHRSEEFATRTGQYSARHQKGIQGRINRDEHDRTVQR